MPDILSLATQLIEQPSITPNAAQCFDVIESHLKPLGFNVFREVFSENGAPDTENLYARLGTGSPNLCFAGHIDVVPPGNLAAWKFPPFTPTEHEGALYGRGAEDMKGAVAAMIAAAARYVKEHSGVPYGSISFLLTADEEGSAVNGTRKMLGWLKEKGEALDFCLVGEPTNPTYLGEMAKIGRRGSINCLLEVKGVQGHVAYPALADNPITRLVAMLQKLKSTPLDRGNAFFPPSNLEITTIDVGNTAENVIPEQASAKFNIRFNDHYTGESIQRWITAQCDAIGGEYTLRCRVSGESFITPPGILSDTLVEAIREITGKTPALSTTGGTSDARFIKDFCPVIEFGTTGATSHKIDERVDVAVLGQLTEIYYRFIQKMLKN